MVKKIIPPRTIRKNPPINKPKPNSETNT
jgi:hypothetical protein